MASMQGQQPPPVQGNDHAKYPIFPGGSSNLRMVQHCQIPVATILAAFPPPSNPFRILEDLTKVLDGVAPASDSTAAIPAALRDFHIKLQKDAANQFVVITGNLPVLSVRAILKFLVKLPAARRALQGRGQSDIAQRVELQLARRRMHKHAHELVVNPNMSGTDLTCYDKALFLAGYRAVCNVLGLEGFTAVNPHGDVCIALQNEAARWGVTQELARYDILSLPYTRAVIPGFVYLSFQTNLPLSGVVGVAKLIYANLPPATDLAATAPGIANNTTSLGTGYLRQSFLNFLGGHLSHLLVFPEIKTLLRHAPQLAADLMARAEPYLELHRTLSDESAEYPGNCQDNGKSTFSQMGTSNCGSLLPLGEASRDIEKPDSCMCGMGYEDAEDCDRCGLYEPGSDGDEESDEDADMMDIEAVEKELRAEARDLLQAQIQHLLWVDVRTRRQ
ncbi:hypothetical protein BJ508DRAFT_305632 [Ascobolus immersus RN42]|uniref:Uncharacterized protein n=1 Tax=Ascobolus immersus RN42 TaxID=1160509 RepID=A0A3N4ILK1_ASCIM|nr:hypothetical protein BJ508DRAFT_305632 [Ascobolus immersus RN42]